MRIRKGDNVMVISGKDKGKTGKVINAFPKIEKVIVEGVNIAKRHQRPRREGQQGQIVDKVMPVHVSNVQLIDPKTSKRTRIGVKKNKAGKNVRVALKSGTELES